MTLLSEKPKYTNQLHGKRVLVIGGTSGIGFAVAEAAVEHGATVTICGSKPEKLEKALERLRKAYSPMPNGPAVFGRCCDLFDAANMDLNLHNLLQVATGDSNEKINHVVFTAADMVQPPPLSSVTVEEIQKIGIIRYAAPAIVGKLLPQYMELSPENSYTLTSGAHTHKPDPGWAIIGGYCGAVEALMKGFAIDLKPLRINVVSPGAVLTEVVKDILGDALEENLKAAKEKSTTGTLGRPEDVAQAYLYVMKDQYISGSVVHSNGGILLR